MWEVIGFASLAIIAIVVRNILIKKYRARSNKKY